MNEGYSIREIAKEVGASKSTVDRLHKAESEPGDDETYSGTPEKQENPLFEKYTLGLLILKLKIFPILKTYSTC